MRSALLQLLDCVRCAQPISNSKSMRSQWRYEISDLLYRAEAVKNFLSEQLQLLIRSGLVPEKLDDRAYWDTSQKPTCSLDRVVANMDKKCIKSGRMIDVFYKAIVARLQKEKVLQNEEVECLNNWAQHIYLLARFHSLTRQEQNVFQIETMRRKVTQLTMPRLVADNDQL